MKTDWKFTSCVNVFGFYSAQAMRLVGNTIQLVQAQAVRSDVPSTDPNNTEERAFEALRRKLASLYNWTGS